MKKDKILNSNSLSTMSKTFQSALLNGPIRTDQTGIFDKIYGPV